MSALRAIDMPQDAQILFSQIEHEARYVAGKRRERLCLPSDQDNQENVIDRGATASSTENAILLQMKPAIRKAYLANQYAESKAGKPLFDHEAYKLLQEEGISTDRGDVGELTDYELRAFDTWSRQVREARRALGKQKNTRRTGRQHGGSIAKKNEI